MTTSIETMYYMLYNSVLLGQTSKAKMFLSFLRNEYDENQDQFVVLKSDDRWQHLVQIGNDLDNNLVSRRYEVIEKPKDKVAVEQEDNHFKKQNELVKAICLAQDKLRKCLKAKNNFYCSTIEHETMFGRVDLVAQDETTIYPIEVKKNGGYHELVGQVDKYIMHFKLGLINKIYQHVVGVAIANGFDKYVLQELHKHGAIAIQYKYKENQEIEFIRI
jgi:hypothetical protein